MYNNNTEYGEDPDQMLGSIVLEQAFFIADSDHTTCVAYVTPEVPTSQDIYKQR